MPLVGSDDDAIVCRCGCGNNHIDGTARATDCPTLGNDPSPFDCRVFIKGQNAIAKERLGSQRTGEPELQLSSSSSDRSRKNTPPSFCDRQGGDEEIGVVLGPKPVGNHGRGVGFERFADDIRVEKVACHKSTSRSGTISRVRSKSAPTAGERRNAAQMPPRPGGPSETCFNISVRNRTASASSAARRLASFRTSSLSFVNPRTS